MFRPPPTQGPYARDFEAYYAAGATANAGGNPWSRDVWRVERTIAGVDARRDELLPYVGPAAALQLFRALALIPHALAVRVWSGILAVACAALVLAALMLGGTRRITALLGGLVVVIASGPGTSAIALGQAALVSAAAVACALAAFASRHWAAGALATLIAAMQPNVAIVLTARLRDRATLLSVAVAAIAFAAVTLAAGGGIRGFADYLELLRDHGNAERFVTIQHTTGAIVRAFGAGEAASTAAGLAVAAAAIAAVAVLIVRARLDARDGALLAIAALPFAVPFVHEHDLIVEALPLIVIAVAARGLARVLAGVAAGLIGVDWLGLAQRTAADAQILSLGAACACGFVLLGRGSRVTRADAAPFLAIGIAACALVPLARAHPAPTWPDMLPPAYHAPAGADATATWADEQRAAGLDRPVPAWGVLRIAPLAGCVALGAAIVLAGARRREREPEAA